HCPVHVTLRVAPDVVDLRAREILDTIIGVFMELKDRPEMRVTQFAILSNHIHMIVEAECSSTLARGMQALTVRLARWINRATLRTGKLFVDRYHAHVLRTPREVRNAVRYVRENSRIHAERVGHAWTGETGRTIAGPRAERIPTAS